MDLSRLPFGAAQAFAHCLDRGGAHVEDEIDLGDSLTRAGERRDRAEQLGVVGPAPAVRLRRLFGFADALVVVAPAQLRAELAEKATRIASVYSDEL